MAYMNQDKKKTIKAELDKVLKGTGIKYSVGVRHHSTIVLNISAGPIDFLRNYYETAKNNKSGTYKPSHLQVNVYWYKEHFTGDSLDILSKVIPILNNGNHDNSDSQSDYFDVGWYVDVNIGKWDKPYVYTGE
jgi:hypothetical protein